MTQQERNNNKWYAPTFKYYYIDIDWILKYVLIR